jgi:chitin disaccharide deacetylase
VVLVDGTPILPLEQLSTLLAGRSGQPDRFHSRLSPVAARAVFGGFDPDELTNEIVAQIKKLQAAGVEVTHLDTHKHTHIFPSILRAIVKAARICGVPAIRNPFVPAGALQIRRFGPNPALWKRFGQVRMLRTFAGKFRERMKKSGLASPDGIVGVIETGSLNLERLCQALQHLPDGIWELVCHPGYKDEDLLRANTRLLDARDQERKILMSPELRKFLDEEEIGLIGYRELVRTQHTAARAV